MSASCVPCSTTLPLRMTMMLSALRIVLSRCAMVMVVRPADALSSAACTICSPRTSMADVASSRIRILGALTMARAMAMRCRCPPDSLMPASPTTVS
jgi:hypothetical protein